MREWKLAILVPGVGFFFGVAKERTFLAVCCLYSVMVCERLAEVGTNRREFTGATGGTTCSLATASDAGGGGRARPKP